MWIIGWTIMCWGCGLWGEGALPWVSGSAQALREPPKEVAPPPRLSQARGGGSGTKAASHRCGCVV